MQAKPEHGRRILSVGSNAMKVLGSALNGRSFPIVNWCRHHVESNLRFKLTSFHHTPEVAARDDVTSLSRLGIPEQRRAPVTIDQ
jgi:hypothetical protein